MNIKDLIEVEIEDSGMNGEGVARLDGKVVFVPYSLKGERVRVMIKSVKKNFVNASVVKVLSPSEHRVSPSCPHYFKCGGCDMQHVDSEYRKQSLMSELTNNLKKIADIDASPTVFVTDENAKRNKLSMPFGLVNGRIVLGMYRQGTHVIEPVSCSLVDCEIMSVATLVERFSNDQKLSVYNEQTGRGLLRHFVARRINGGRISVVIVTSVKPKAELMAALTKALPKTVDLFYSVNSRRNNVVMGENVACVSGISKLSVDVLGVKAELSPLSFFQVNDSIRDKLYERAIGLVNSSTLVDIYSGIGITSNLASKKCDKVLAVECVPQAVKDADRTAELNGNTQKIKNVCGDAEVILPTLNIEGECDVLVDPPRKGCESVVVDAIAKLKPNRLIYVSCNHATMCRDIRKFLDVAKENGENYELTVCEQFDMFPNTHHVETLVCLARK